MTEKFTKSTIDNSSVWSLYRTRSTVDPDPEYQRQSDIWTMDKKQLLIDSVINRFDIPKIYLHKPSEPIIKEGLQKTYAVIDGKQRLEAIWGFISGEFSLSNDFVYLHDETVSMMNFTYREMADQYPDIKNDFDSFRLDVVVLETDDIELVDELFSRLNEAATLNAAEKRNAFRGPLPGRIRHIVETDPLFTEKLAISNKRYKQYDLCAKFLYAVHSGGIVDTKKRSLDAFVVAAEKWSSSEADALVLRTQAILQAMSKVFIDKDPLLKSVGIISVYFYLFMVAGEEGWLGHISRNSLLEFDRQRMLHRAKAEDEAEFDIDFLEFDRHSQSVNDIYAIRIRLSILMQKAFNRDFPIRSSKMSS